MDQQLFIRKEYEKNNLRTAEDIISLITHGDVTVAAHHYLFYMRAKPWREQFHALLVKIRHACNTASTKVQQNMLEFLVLLAIGTQSFLANLKLHETIGKDETIKVSEKLFDLIVELESVHKNVADTVCSKNRAVSTNQFIAEGLSTSDAEKEASLFVGKSPSDYVRKVLAKIHASNFYRYSVKHFRESERTIFGNDYGEFLQYTMWLGYSFQTTNPPLIKMIWDLDRAYWIKQLSQVLADEDDLRSNIPRACSVAALLIVEKGCRLLRDWFLLSQGKEGYVCFQVNLEAHNNAEEMVKEAQFVYGMLEKRLGGVPNVSFKLPGTSAGVVAAEELGSLGYSLTITLHFSTFQAMAFGKALKKSKALTSYVVVMNGRLAFPVRDELKLLHNKEDSIPSRLAGVEVTRHIYMKYYAPESEGGLGLDRQRVKVLNASLRIYGSDIPDISEILGTQVITIFPNVRRAYDAIKRDDPIDSVTNETPESVLRELADSELFRQAWWVDGDCESFKPQRVLSLSPEDEEAVIQWPPINQTVTQFIEEYRKLRQIVSEVVADEK